MIKLLKHLKSSTKAICLIVILLVFQSICDLSLPDYTSNIVNVGIQQGGIEDAVPNVIRKSELDKLTIFMTNEDKSYVLDKYTYLNKDSIDKKEYDDYLKKYPKIGDYEVFILKNIDKEVREKLNIIFGKPMLIVEGMSNPEKSSELMKGMLPSADKLPQGQDPISIFSNMPEEQRIKLLSDIDNKFSVLPDSIISQGATSFVKSEYQALGVNTDKLQSNYILKSGGIMLSIALLSMIATVAVGYIGARVAAKLGKELRSNVFRKVVGFSNAELDNFSTASLITRSTNDIQQVQTLMVMLLRVVFYAPILGIGAFIKVINTNTSMAWIIGVAVLSIISVVLVLFSFVIPKFKVVQKLVDKVNLVTREILNGILVIRAFSTDKHEEKRFDKANLDLTKTNLFVTRAMSFMMPIMMLIMNAITILIVWNGAKAIDLGTMQVGDMMAFIQYAMQIIMAFLLISMVSVMLPRAVVAAERVDEVLSTEFIILDKEETKKFDESKKGLVEFKNVSFRYPNAEEDVLHDISFTAKPGETTAFIGSTGSGKSTLINLVPRFYDVTEGEILVDGVNIKDASQKSLRDKIGYVPQKAVLFSGTIETNLKYGNNDTTENEMKMAAEIAQATEFIEAKSEKFQTEIAQGGTNVSGGQKQRLSIARALAKNPEIIIFDDSFSALDLKTDSALRNAIAEKISDKTILLVAQRISTIINAEQIIVLDEGKLVGKGKHHELMKTCEVYRQIALSQLSKEELGHE